MNESIHGERTASEPEDRVTELVEQQTAIAEVLRAIASSPHDLQPIFDAILDSATWLCRADIGSLRLSEESDLRRVAVRGDPFWLIRCGHHSQCSQKRGASNSHKQSELAHANRVATMGQLTASIAHEIKQPIATARNNAAAALRFLEKSPPDVAEVREALICIVSDTDRASDVVDRIGSLVKKAPPRKEAVDLNAAIREVTALTHGEAVKTGVTVATQLADDAPPIRCDRVQLQQVMLNLIVNAIQSMSGVEDGDRELHISTASVEPEGVCVAVRDTGPGLRPESLPRVFEPFYTTKPDGMGMGLSICRSIIEAHDGRLWATRCEPRGALFQFAIPAE